MHQLQPDEPLQSSTVVWVVDLETGGDFTMSSAQPCELGKNHKFSGFCHIISNIYSNSSSLALFSVGKTSKIESINQKSRGHISYTLGLSKCLFACSSEWGEVIFVMVTQIQNMAGLPMSP